MREVILVGAPWCGACKAMKAWFGNLELPGVLLLYIDMEEIDSNDAAYMYLDYVTSLPTILFLEGDNIVQTIPGALNRHDVEHAVQSLWPDMAFSAVAA